MAKCNNLSRLGFKELMLLYGRPIMDGRQPLLTFVLVCH